MAPLAENENMMKDMVKELDKSCQIYAINVKKTKRMVISKEPKKMLVSLKVNKIEQVQSSLLGIWILGNRNAPSM